VYCVVPVKEIYFTAPSDAQLSDVNYVYPATSNASRYHHTESRDHTGSRGRGSAGARRLDDVVGGPRRVRQLTVTESLPASLYCIASGGYPAPRLRMLVNDRDVTDSFRHESTFRLRGVAGMRVIDIQSELYSREWSVEADDDLSTVRCTAFVDRRLGEQFAAITLHVRRMYIIRPT